MSGTNILLTHGLPGKAVELGRLVPSIHYPEQDFFQSQYVVLGPSDVLIQKLPVFQRTLGNSKDSGFKS